MKRLLSWFRRPGAKSAPETALELPTYTDILVARDRIAPLIPRTPVTRSIGLSEDLGLDLSLKWDNKLRTGSFKERGAANFLLSLTDAEKKRGVCAASAGNHALGLSYYAKRLDIACHLVMPITAPLVKVESCRRNEAHVTLRGNTFAEAYEYAVTYARENGLTYIPPFDHPRIIAGQGTCGLEIVEQLPNIDSVVVPVGGGGLISGIALAIKEQRPDIFILGVRSEWAERAKYDPASLAARRVPPSIADGIAVKDIGNYPREIITRLVDKMVTVTDVEVADAIIRHLELEHSVIEGAAAAGLAALYQRALPEQYKRPCFVICGSNIDPTLLSHLIERNMNGRGRILRLQVSLPDRPGTLHDLSGTVATAGANIVEVHHDRFNSALPGSADVTIVAEVRNSAHAAEVEQAVALAGFTSRRAG